MTRFGLLSLLLVLCSLNQAASEVYYITTTSICPMQLCLTLSQFAINSSNYLHSNTTLVFLPGTHYLSTVNLTLSNVDNFVMKSENSTAQIKCTNDSHFHFSKSQFILITNLEFIGCGGNQVISVEEFVVQDTKFKGEENSGTALRLLITTAQIVNSSFISNRKGSYRKCFIPSFCYRYEFVGGAIIATNSAVYISQSSFEDNEADFGGAIFAEQHCFINMSGNVFLLNYATRYGGVLASYYNNTITIEASEFHNNSATRGGVLHSSSNNTITIEASEFHRNSATWSGGVLYSSYNNTITIEASEFHNNSATRGGVLYSFSKNSITLEASEFHGNSATRDGGVLASYNNNTVTIEASEFYSNSAAYGGVLDSFRNDAITIDASQFQSNSATHGGVLYSSYNSGITIEASQFHRNNATRNGGVLDSSSNNTITIDANQFQSNCATHGGVLYSSYNNGITIEASEFHHNSATRSGGVLYSSYSNAITIEASQFHSNSASYGGVLYSFYNNAITIEASQFHSNSAVYGGVLDSFRNDTITIDVSQFQSNSATHGGVLYSSYNNAITIEASQFHRNSAIRNGGVLDSSSNNTIIIDASQFHSNSATWSGGVLLSSYSITVTIEASEFHNNSATRNGGVLYSYSSTITIDASQFHSNSATWNGGVLASYNSTITIDASQFHSNSATWYGGVLYSSSSTITTGGSNFTKNVSPTGAVVHAIDGSKIQYRNYLLIYNNSANTYAVVYLSDSEFSGNDSENTRFSVTFSSNLGSLVAFNSNITFMGSTKFMNNQPPQTTTDNFQEGGAITLFQSNAFLDGTCRLEHNHAENGGATLSTESKLYVTGDVTIAHNTATRNGGGVYLSNSELNCQRMSTLSLFNNTAVQKGGGVHAISSSIKATSAYLWSQYTGMYTGTRINITKNTAKKGGGLSLEANAKFYILKYDRIPYYIYTDTNTSIFTANEADYGGAVYVDDDTNSGTCASEPKTECFFQVLAIHGLRSQNLRTQSIHFSQNYANISGATLYGGLLDRCAVSQFAEVHNKDYAGQYKGNGVPYFDDISNSTGESTSVSSDPVRVCFCISSEHNCTHQSHIEVKKGEMFTVTLAAVNQIGKPVNGTIQTSLNFTESGLAEGQLAREIPAECTNLSFNVVSPKNSENLTLYASDGPCKDADLSRGTIEIHFLPCSCPIGLQLSGVNTTNCTCECHSDISQYVEKCDSGSLIKQPQSRAWISYFNDTDLTGYLVYPNCPFDYCLSISLSVDLNRPNGADVQCAFSRSSLLCGSCQPGLSLSLGSSRCLPCPSYWPALLIAITIAAILAGIALVAFLLVLNMTVAVGSLNGLIFYANIVYANKTILLPFQETNFITVFISWLNLELGIDTCYFPGMDTYTKTWLQLAFPAYVILLVVLVIIISSYSTKFSNLIGKKNPVATLATLILLSYAKLIEICFKSLSVGTLKYPDEHPSEMLWLPDATVRYLSRKHIPLFLTAVLILLVGLVYTALLFLWQWFLFLPRWRIFKWLRNPKIQTFIETHHTPYTPKHRYWTGLLLIIRIVLYLVSAVNVSNDPTVALTAISFTVCCIFALRELYGSRIYRKWTIDVLETLFYLNILSFVIFTWYLIFDPDSNRKAAAYTSVIITFIVLLLIILYHVYTYTTVFSKIENTIPGRMIDRLLTDADPKLKPKRHWSPPPDDDIHRFYELLDMIDRPVNTNDYTVAVNQKPVKPTQSVVEVHQPYVEPPDPEEASDTQHAAEAVQVRTHEVISQV